MAPLSASSNRSATYRIGQCHVAFSSESQTLIRRVEPLFDAFDRSDVSPTTVVSLVSANGDDGPRFSAALDGERVCPDVDWPQFELALTRRINRLVLDAEVALLHLHAGAVTRNGRTVLVAGSSFAGKSTLVAKLVAAGWSYLSDEQVAVTNDGRLQPYPRPITLRAGSWELFDQTFSGDDQDSAADRIEVPPSKLGRVYRGEPMRPNLVVFPDVSTTSFSLTALPSAETLSLLIENTLDLERAGPTGLQSMLAVVAAAPAYRITGTDVYKTISGIDELCASAKPTGPMCGQASVDLDERSTRTPGSLAWLFPDESAGLYEPVSGSFVYVDRAGYDAWEMLGRQRDVWPDGLAESAFVRGLSDAGLLQNELT